EPEARLMRTARHGHQVAYNAQTAVDAKHGLIADFDLTNEGNDERQLHPMAARGRAALEVEAVTVVADTGNPAGAQYFPRTAFRYEAASDAWQCPAGQTLSRRQVSHSERKWKYWTTACRGCALMAQCTGAAKRTIVRG